MRQTIVILLTIFSCAQVSPCEHIDWARNFDDAVANDRAANDRARDQMLIEILPKLTKEDPSLAAAEIPGLVEQLNRREDKIRLQASAILAALAEFRPDSATVLAQALQALMYHAQDSAPRICGNSVRALSFLHPEIPDDELEFLIRLMGDKDEQLAAEAAFGVARMAGSRVDAANAIEMAILQNDRSSVRLAAIRVVPVARPTPPRFISILGGVLTDSDTQVVHAALEAIGRSGASAIRANLDQLNQLAETSTDKESANFAQQLIQRLQ